MVCFSLALGSFDLTVLSGCFAASKFQGLVQASNLLEAPVSKPLQSRNLGTTGVDAKVPSSEKGMFI